LAETSLSSLLGLLLFVERMQEMNRVMNWHDGGGNEQMARQRNEQTANGWMIRSLRTDSLLLVAF